MKTRYLFPLLFTLLGCTSNSPHASRLTADQAQALAQKLANEKAQILYHCQPFRNAPPASFVQGHWTWHDRRGQGNGDMEATVEFAADGSAPQVNVTWLDGRAQ